MSTPTPTPKRANVSDIFPLSALQEGMLFHSLLDPESGVYTLQDCYRLRGEIDPTAFLAAWQRVVDAHPTLRTSFVWQTQRKPLQVVHAQVKVPAVFVDLCHLEPGAQETEIQALLASEAARPFDLTRPPLIRFQLVKLAADRYVFLRTFHHILMDAWSVALTTVDFVQAYEALRVGREPTFTRARPYRDFVHWFGQRDPALSKAFFARDLARVDEPTRLPARVAQRSERYAAAVLVDDVTTRMPAALSAQLRDFCREQGLTLSTLFQATWALILARYAGQRDVLFGITVAGRPPGFAGVESMVGLFINTLPLVASVTPDAVVLAWLHALQQHNVELRDHEHTPLSDLTGLAPFGSEQPLFDSLLVYENAPIDEALIHGRLSFAIERT
ncbi:MAG: condensation domain-containing protein, partial [Polyangiales bacterium]